MRTATAITLGMALLGTAAQAQEVEKTTTTQAKANKYEGAYMIVSGENNGKPAPDEQIKGTSMRITGDTIVVADKDEKDLYIAKYTLDDTKSPAVITMTETGGPSGRKGAKAVGIIKKDGDDLMLAYCYEGGIVPTDFKTKAGAKQLSFTMKRKDKGQGLDNDKNKDVK